MSHPAKLSMVMSMINTALLKRLRLERAWSLAELARRAKLHPSSMSRIEGGKEAPYPGPLKRLARVLGTTPDALMVPGPHEVDR